MTQRTITIDLCDEPFVLHPAKIVWWPRRSTLLLADTHFGKAATFRQAGLPVPAGMTQRMLDRWSDLMVELRPERMMILGDLVHSATSATRDFETELLRWRVKYSSLVMLLIRGNHDRGHKQLFRDLRLELLTEPYREDSFAFCHQPNLPIDPQSFCFAGHLHPGVQLVGPAGDRLKLPCFQIQHRTLILPAFGEFTGLSCRHAAPGATHYAIIENVVQRV